MLNSPSISSSGSYVQGLPGAVADPFPRAGLSFLDSLFVLFFLPDLEPGHPEVVIRCPSPPFGSVLWTLTPACTGMEFATPPWASGPRPLALSLCPGQFPKAPSYFCSCPSLPFSGDGSCQSGTLYNARSEDQMTSGTQTPSYRHQLRAHLWVSSLPGPPVLPVWGPAS